MKISTATGRLLLIGAGCMMMAENLAAGPGGRVPDSGVCPKFAPDMKNDPPPAVVKPFLYNNEISGGLPGEELQIYAHQAYPPPVSSPVSWRNLVEDALACNPTTRLAWQQATAAAFSFRSAKGAYAPDVTGSAGIKPTYGQKVDFQSWAKGNGANGASRTWEVDYAPQIQATYLIADFGGRQAQVDMARYNLLAADFAINQSMQKVVLATLIDYYTWRETKEIADAFGESVTETANPGYQLKINEADQKAAPGAAAASGTDPAAQSTMQEKIASTLQTEEYKTLSESQGKLVATIHYSDYVQYQAALASEKAAMIQLAASIGFPAETHMGSDYQKESVEEIKRWMQSGRKDPNDPPMPAFINHNFYRTDGLPQDDPMPAFAASIMDTLLQRAICRRPDLANACAIYKAAVYSAKVANSNVYPTLNANFAASATDEDLILHKDDPGSVGRQHNLGRNDNFAGGITVTVPTIFDGFTLLNKARAARATADAARSTLANAESAALTDVATSLQAYLYSITEFQVAKDAVVSANDSYASLAATYTDGSKSLVKTQSLSTYQSMFDTVYNAQFALDTARQTLAQRRLNVYVTALQLCNSIGELLPATLQRGTDPVAEMAQWMDDLHRHPPR